MLQLIISPTLALRTYEEEDSAELFAVVDKNRTHLRPWLVWVDATLKEAQSLEYIRAAKQEQYEQKSVALGIFENDKLIGGIGMHQWNQRLRKAQIGYWLAKDAEGKGILKNSAITFINYLFSNLNLNKIELQYLIKNSRSEAAAKSLGFVIEGILRDHFLMNGTFHDIVTTGLLQREWRQNTLFTREQ